MKLSIEIAKLTCYNTSTKATAFIYFELKALIGSVFKINII